MSCDNCEGTVWFDHDKGVWKHGAPPTDCTKPLPYNISKHRES